VRSVKSLQIPGVRTPSKHELGTHRNPGKPVFVHDTPDASASVQSPGPSAFGSNSEASQLAARSMCVNGVVKWCYDGGDGF
jgi:hypothetical protein